MIGFLVTFLNGVLLKYFLFLAGKLGFQLATNLVLATLWLALIASFTSAAGLCLSSDGTCGSLAGNWTGLSTWLKFGLSLVPSESIQIIGCLLSLHVAGWSAIAINRLVNKKNRI